MTVISSQRETSEVIVEEKIEEFQENGTQVLIIPVVKSFMQDLGGNDLYIMTDGHHRLQAAKALGLRVEFEVIEDFVSYRKDIEEENGENILAAWYHWDPWYYISCDTDKNLVDCDVW